LVAAPVRAAERISFFISFLLLYCFMVLLIVVVI